MGSKGRNASEAGTRNGKHGMTQELKAVQSFYNLILWLIARNDTVVQPN